MINGDAAASAICCSYGTNNGNAALGLPRGSARSVTGKTSGAPQTIGQKIVAALDNAIHGGDSGKLLTPGQASQAFDTGSGRNVIDFPMVNPFKPVVRTRVPVPGLTAKPRYLRVVKQAPGTVPDDEQFAGLGETALEELNRYAPLPPVYKPPVSYTEYPSSGGSSKLQTILGTIQATLPATIQALRAQPANIYPGAGVNPYATPDSYYPQQQPGANIGAQAGAAVGNVGDTIGNIVQQHPLLVLGGGMALLLLFMNPPRRR